MGDSISLFSNVKIRASILNIENRVNNRDEKIQMFPFYLISNQSKLWPGSQNSASHFSILLTFLMLAPTNATSTERRKRRGKEALTLLILTLLARLEEWMYNVQCLSGYAGVGEY